MDLTKAGATTAGAIAPKEPRVSQTTEFVAACCCWPHTQDTRARVHQTASALNNWEEAKQSVIRHRVVSLVHMAIKDLEVVPSGFREWARQEAQKTAIGAMQLTHDCIKIDAAFRAAGVQPLHFKGPVLGQICYGSVAMKFSHDLDIFVAKQDVFAATKVLEKAGYQISEHIKTASEKQIAALMRNFKDACFRHPNGRLIELHWKFTNTNKLLLELEQNQSREQVEVANLAKLDTLNATQTISYLCVHGALHHWVRLKWLADFSAYLNQLSHADRDAALEYIIAGSSRDALAQALMLCDTLFATKYAPQLSSRARKLYDYSLMRIDGSYLIGNRFQKDMGFISRVFAMRHLHDTPWSALHLLQKAFVGADDVLALPLPRALNWIYPIIRAPSYIFRRLKS